MKSIITLFLILFSATLFAQQSDTWPRAMVSFGQDYYQVVSVKNDTLEIPIGKYKFIKVGDKIYEINYSLEEVKPEEQGLRLWNRGSLFAVPNGTFTPSINNIGSVQLAPYNGTIPAEPIHADLNFKQQ